ncbi:hypothetical protein P7D92_06490 [Enterococcus dongliensis]|uniref:hypothetical protein n=1 Tax=Enterococcus dongliensis TaxID=2559925 RepID=UPI00288C702D|nr:hypothetical protein [Enterococcus dongliensis]MDT2676624.1 hypothetical protein [Enterococcus dongliensis]
MKIDNERYQNYLDFVSSNYPNSDWSDSKKEKIVYMNILNSISCLDVYTSVKHKKSIQTDLLKDLIVLLRHCLFLLPLKNPISYHAIMRAICETIMKIMYSSIYPNETSESIRKLNYRYLSDTIDSDVTLKKVVGENTLKVKNGYANSSNQIHSKSGFSKFDAPYLTTFWSSSFVSTDTIKNDSTIIYEFISKSIYVLNKYDSNDFGHNQKNILLDMN